MQKDTSACLTLGTGYSCRASQNRGWWAFATLVEPQPTQPVHTAGGCMLGSVLMTNTNLSAAFQSLLEASGWVQACSQTVWAGVELESNAPACPKNTDRLTTSQDVLVLLPFSSFLAPSPTSFSHCITQIKTWCSSGKRVFYKTGWHGCGLSKLISLLDGNHK